MKTAMKLTTGILAIMITAGAAYAQNPDAIDNARSVAKSLQQKQANDSNAALDAAGVPSPAKPSPSAPAPAVKPATIPGAKQVTYTPVAAPAPAPITGTAAKPASTAHNQLQKVNVVPGADKIQIELTSSQMVNARVSKLKSPDRILIELPETTVASAQNKIAVNAGGVKGVRIGVDGKNPPTTSVVIDLEKSLSYDYAPSLSGKSVLTISTQGGTPAAASAPAKTAAAPVAAKAVAAPAPAQAKTPTPVATKTAPAKPAVAPVAKTTTVADVKDPFLKSKTAAPAAKADSAKSATAPAKAAEPAKAETKVEAKAEPKTEAKGEDKKAEEKKGEKKPEDKKWAMSGKRDPFFSPVVQQQGSGCSTGKKCLEIGNINLRGVVKSDNGFIAVVTNSLNKAYFLRENDPVFNGYVLKITGDSVTFQETVQDKLGKSFTREVVKRIFTPAV